MVVKARARPAAVLVPLIISGFVSAARGQVDIPILESLKAYSRLPAGDPAVPSTWEDGTEGPKGIAAADLDGVNGPDLAVSNLDGTVTVYLNRGDGQFGPPVHLRTGGLTLREVVIADLTPGNQVALPDIAVCALGDAVRNGAVVIFPNQGNGFFGPPFHLTTWKFGRNLAAGDFDGDGWNDLAVGGSLVGVRIYRGRAGGPFPFVPVWENAELFGTGSSTSKPVFSLKTYRPAGLTRDILLVTHAELNRLFVLRAVATGVPPGVAFTATELPGVEGIYDFDIAPVLVPAAVGRPDLITAHRNNGKVQIRKGIDGPALFESQVVPGNEIPIPGGPRAVKIIDLNQDGWNDLVVVERNLDRVLTFRNQAGTLVPVAELPVGRSPRGLAVGEFKGDHNRDAAVINRFSSDISLLTGTSCEFGFSTLDQIHLVEGEVVDLAVEDLNDDGRDDVIQLHRASGEISVRLAGPGGVLEPPSFYLMGTLPSALRLADLNNDGFLDVATANLGRQGGENGSISFRLNDGSGNFQELHQERLPPEVVGRLFSIELADFDRDGKLDAAAGFLDSGIGFFRGQPDGSLAFSGSLAAVYQGRSMAAGDFDEDGLPDLAVASWSGELLIARNSGGFFKVRPEFDRQVYPPLLQGSFRTQALKAGDLDGDGDLDLVLGTGAGALVYRGGQGATFPATEALPGTDRGPATGVAIADFDGDGRPDLVVSSLDFSSVTFLKQSAGGAFEPLLTVGVPSGKLIAAGDLDGDTLPDLVGSGSVLWTALSSGVATASCPQVEDRSPNRTEHVVINEILASNLSLPIGPPIASFPTPRQKTLDYVEIFNGAQTEVDLSGYLLQRGLGVSVPEYRFPEGTKLPAGGHLLLFCSKDELLTSPYKTNFKLPSEGGTLVLFDKGGSEIDRMEYPPQRPDVSFGRFRDGLPAFAYNPIPSPGAANLDNGVVKPLITLQAALPASWRFGDEFRPLRPGEGVRFLATASDDVGIISIRLFYGPADVPRARLSSIILYDDGQHEDGDLQDGLFSGLLEQRFPPGGGACLTAEVDDLNGEVTVAPDEPDFGSAGDGRERYCLVVLEEEESDLKITEVVSSNIGGYPDGAGGYPDWVEVGNLGDTDLPLKGLYLAERFPNDGRWLALPDRTLKAGEYLVIFCDGQTDQGELHAPFELKQTGGHLILAREVPLGPGVGYAAVQNVDYPELKTNMAYAYVSCRWRIETATPKAPNLADLGDVDQNGRREITDAVQILRYLYLATPLGCVPAADTNRDSQVDLSDAIYLLLFLFGGGPFNGG